MWTRINQPFTIPSEVRAIVSKLFDAGFEAYLVGGCVRDFLMGKVPHDFDIASNARPEDVEHIFEKVIEVGRAFGVMKVQTETDIAVLQIQVKNIEDKVGEIKNDVKQLHDALDKNSNETRTMLKEMREEDNAAHDRLSSKVSALEKWRWMLMGAGVILGSIGFDTIAKLVK
jgi:ubiquitin C-terminal hydrolase